MNINDMTDEDQIIEISLSSKSFNLIKNPSEIVQIFHVSNNGGDFIKYINNPSKSVQLAAVRQEPISIRYIIDPDDDVILLASFHQGWEGSSSSLQYHKHSRHIQIISILRDANSIQYFENPDEKLQLLAVKQSPKAIRGIQYPTKKVQRLALQAENEQHYPSNKIYTTAGFLLNEIKNLSEKIIEEEVKENYWILSHYDRKIRLDENFQLKWISINPKVIKFFPLMKVKAQRLALKLDPMLINKYPKKFTSAKIKREFKHVYLPGSIGIFEDEDND